MLSNFQVMLSVWSPERLTVFFAAKVNTSAVVEVAATSAVAVPTALYASLASVPAAPVPPVQLAAAQLTSDAAHVIALSTDGVKLAAAACTDILSCLVAESSTMPVTVTLAASAAVELLMSTTLNVTPVGTVTVACSDTSAVSVVDWLVSGSVTVVCAQAVPPASATIATSAMINSDEDLILPTSQVVESLPRPTSSELRIVWGATDSVWVSVFRKQRKPNAGYNSRPFRLSGGLQNAVRGVWRHA